MKILVFGGGGQVGREIEAAAADFRDCEIRLLRRADADLATPGAAAALIRNHRPASVINAAAWTAVDKAESARDEAMRINALAAEEIAAATAACGARLVHISTDYVFPGDNDSAPLAENAPTRPLNVYGETKLRGEQLAAAANPETVILRTSWVYSAYGSNFLKTMLRLGAERDELPVVADQYGGPTPASAIAHAAIEIGRRTRGPVGIYHFQGKTAASWADFAEAIINAGGLKTRIRRIPTSDYPTPALRPHFTVLNCSKIERDYGLFQPDWRSGLREVVSAATAHSG